MKEGSGSRDGEEEKVIDIIEVKFTRTVHVYLDMESGKCVGGV